MASLTISIDSEILEAARLEADRRKTSLEQMVSEYLSSVAHKNESVSDTQNLVRLMREGILGHIDRPMTRDEIYAERTGPRS